MRTLLLSILFLAIGISLHAQISFRESEELGQVHWLRDLEQALKLAEQEGKPVFLLFQEVPGCATCRNYGRDVMSHPLIVEAIESEFIPLAIFNNRKGKDAEVLQQFGEPAWNNPVVRIIHADRQDLTARIAGNYSRLGVVEGMVQALQETGRKIPAYLELYREELEGQTMGTTTAYLAMHCFWTGEMELGRLPGVQATKPGLMGGREVVQVEYAPDALSYEKLLHLASAKDCAEHIFTDDPSEVETVAKVRSVGGVSAKGDFRPDREPKYYLSRTHYRFVPMTPLQAARVNSRIGQGLDPSEVLSPRQCQLADFIRQHPEKNWPEVIGADVQKVWKAIETLWED